MLVAPDAIFYDICTMLFNRNNFHKKTFCIFKSALIPERAPDHVSKSGSQYWFGQHGVFRNSNHWGRAAKCKWRLVGDINSGSRTRCGFANWSDFNADDDSQKLYFIRIDGSKPDYFHKNTASFKGDFLRTSAETTKRLRQVRRFLETENPDDDHYEQLLTALLSTDLPTWKIRATLTPSP